MSNKRAFLDKLLGRYVIDHITKDRFLYKEGERSLVIYGEMLSGEFDFVIYSSAIANWMPPHQREKIAAGKKTQILKRLSQFMAGRGIKYILDEAMSFSSPA